MLQLCYVSSANDKFKTTELVKLLKQSRLSNENNAITGLLLYDGIGTFEQVIEGDSEKVEALFSKIKNDSRHKRVNLLSRLLIQDRSFGNWCMGFRYLNHLDIKNLEGFSDFLNDDVSKLNKINHEDAGLAIKLLEYFKQQAKTEAEDKHNI